MDSQYLDYYNLNNSGAPFPPQPDPISQYFPHFNDFMAQSCVEELHLYVKQ